MVSTPESRKRVRKIIKEIRKSSKSSKYIVRGSLTKIAKKFGFSREYIRLISKRVNLVPVNDKRNKINYPTFKCSGCGMKYKPSSANKYYKEKLKNNFCSLSCYHQWYKDNHRVRFKCTICNKIYDVRLSQIKKRLRNGENMSKFCSNQCKGKWLGDNYGKISLRCRK